MEQQAAENKIVSFKDIADVHHYPFILKRINTDEKKTHLWLYGETNSGKTYFVEQLMRLGINVFMGPYNNDWIGFN